MEILDSVQVDNGKWGKNGIWVNYQTQVYVDGDDGHRYHAEFGFLSTPESLATIQEYWSYAARGGGNWKMIVMIRDTVSWVSCTSEVHVCHESSVSSGQCSFMASIHLKPHVWKMLLNDYLAGGWRAVTLNPHYHDIQAAVFNPICGAVPGTPCIGFKFTRAD